MIGLIWFVQVVHYPLFKYVGDEFFKDYEKQHCNYTSFIVTPVMAIELATGYLVIFLYEPLWEKALWINFIAIIILWASTGLIQAPTHAKLAKGFCKEQHKRLVRLNWFRTALWSTRGVIISMVLLAKIT